MSERDGLEDSGVEGRIILRWIFRKWDSRYGLDSSASRQGQVAVTCECGNEPSGSIECGEFLDRVRTHQHLQDSALWSKYVSVRHVQPSKGHPQGLRLMHFSSMVNKMSYHGDIPLCCVFINEKMLFHQLTQFTFSFKGLAIFFRLKSIHHQAIIQNQ